MSIVEACAIVRQWHDVLSLRAPAEMRSSPGNLVDAVQELKRFLEREVGDGRRINELEIADALLMTRQGVRWVMPFVLSAESLQRAKFDH